MKPTRQIHDHYHNPFHNRFHVPVHSRLDEMQAFTHMVWLGEPTALDDNADNNRHSRRWRYTMVAAIALVLLVTVIVSATMLSS